MKKKILLSAMATIIMVAVMRLQGRTLESGKSPLGIISMEMAATTEQAGDIIQAVGEKALVTNTLLDFLFIAAYTSFFVYCCVAFEKMRCQISYSIIRKIAPALAIVAGILDVIENCFLLATISGHGNDFTVTATRWAAIAKFSLIGVLLLYLIAASLLTFIFAAKAKKT